MTTNPGLALPGDFVWGVATSSYQIEGAVTEDGRLPSIWDTFCRTPGKIAGDDTGDVACDHYHRWAQDIALMSTIGVDAYRFSVAWPRVRPHGGGPVNRAGLGFYDRLVDELLAAGITPYPTLYHWDLPQALQDRGGWTNRDTAEIFAEYAGIVTDALGDRVAHWTTLNEPRCVAWIGHLEGRHAPGISDIAAAVPASYHLLLGHGLAVQAIRAQRPEARVGLVNLLSACEPASARPADIAAAERLDGHANRWWLDPLYGRGFPEDMLRVYQTDPPALAGDEEVIAAPLDWLGVNYYAPSVVADDPDGPPPYAREAGAPDGARRTLLDWEIRADGLEQVLLRLTRDYSPARIIVTENGSAWADTVTGDGQVRDPARLRYLQEHLASCARAAGQGAPLGGYFAWSLLDNFEWADGYRPRFGLVYVDFSSQRRILKDSGAGYADIIAAHRAAAGARPVARPVS
jgi:beta-glucosidase